MKTEEENQPTTLETQICNYKEKGSVVSDGTP